MLDKQKRILKWVAAEIRDNPTTRNHPFSAWLRFAGWQIRKRISTGRVVVPFLGKSKLVLPCHGEGGAWINAVTGLGEFHDLGFVMHGLKDTDVFIDAGANVGVYTIAASGEIGARSYSFEPSPPQYAVLLENVKQNNMEQLVDARNEAVGECEKDVFITTDLGSLDHIVEAPGNGGKKIKCVSLDSALGKTVAGFIMMKIDVEGYEFNVLKGAESLFAESSVFAVLVETHGYGEKYGGTQADLDAWFRERGYDWYSYDAVKRELAAVNIDRVSAMTNRLYVKNREFVLDRVKTAESFIVNNREF